MRHTRHRGTHRDPARARRVTRAHRALRPGRATVRSGRRRQPVCRRPGWADAGGPLALRSRVLAALARTLRHGSDQLPGAEVTQVAQRAAQLAAAANDPSALATAKLAVHDAMWIPGTAASRLPVIAEMLDAAQASGDDDLVAQARLLRAAALLELGDPAGR